MRTPAFIVLFTLLATPIASAQTLTFFAFDPLVIAPDTGSVRLEATIQGQATEVVLRFQAGTTRDVPLRDDGTQGDRHAGDGVYTATLQAAEILSALRSDDVQRVFVGFLDVISGSTTALRVNMFADVYTSSVPAVSIVTLAADVQAAPHLVNVNDPAFFSDSSVPRVTQTFYRLFGDDYDFLNIVSTPSQVRNRTHGIVRNDVDGIGVGQIDNSRTFGSAGRLRGISQFPNSGFFDGASRGYTHELGHQWINQLNMFPFASGRPHWPLSSMASGIMGFSIGGTGGEGGTFPCYVVSQGGNVQLRRPDDMLGFTDFDLYLMGLVRPEDVEGHVVFPDQTTAAFNQIVSLCDGRTYTGAVIRTSVQDVIAALGPRRPDVSQSPKQFRAATILVTRDGLLGQQAMWLYDWLAARAEERSSVPIHDGFSKGRGQPFFVATGGRATLVATVDLAQAAFDLVPTPSSATVARGQAASYTINIKPSRSTFDAEVTFACSSLPQNASCAFSPPRAIPGATGTDVRLTISTTAGAQVDPSARVMSGLALIGLVLLARRAGRGRSVTRRAWPLALWLLQAACGGGNNQPPSSPPGSATTTPSGTYSVTVTGTSGSVQRSTSVTLTVQ